MIRLLLLTAFLLFLPQAAKAACTSPDGLESQTQYDFTAHTLNYCDGTNWLNLAGGGGLTGMIAAFAATSCPTGWTEYTAARGRFLRGIDPSGSTAVDPAGTRAPGNVQVDEFKSHTHGINYWNGAGSGRYNSIPNIMSLTGSVANSSTSAMDAAGGTETRPKNVAVIFCQYSGSGGGGGGGSGVADGDKGDITVSGSGATWMIKDDVLDFTELSDTLTLDASTDIAASGTNALSITNTGTGLSLRVNDDTSSDTTPFVIDAAGNVGIGTTSPSDELHLATGGPRIRIQDTAGSGNAAHPEIVFSDSGDTILGTVGYDSGSNSDFTIDNRANADTRFMTNSTERLRISSTGNVGIGTTDPQGTLSVVGNGIFGPDGMGASGLSVGAGVVVSASGYLYVKRAGTGGQSMMVFYNNSGVSPTVVGTINTSGSATTYNTSSDRRLKENIRDTASGLDALMRIEVSDFNFIEDEKRDNIQGFIAQQLYEIYPEAVSKGDQDEVVQQPWTVDYGRITPLLTKAIQELKADNDNLRSILEAQGREIEALKSAR